MKRLILILLSCMFVSQAFCTNRPKSSWQEFEKGAVDQLSNSINFGLKMGTGGAVLSTLFAISYELKHYGWQGDFDFVDRHLSGAITIGTFGVGLGFLGYTGCAFLNKGSKVFKYICTEKNTSNEKVAEVAWRDGGAFACSAGVLALGCFLAV